MTPSEYWGNQGSAPNTIKPLVMKEQLEKMSMKEIRNFVKENNLRASDNSKEELINEILEEI